MSAVDRVRAAFAAVDALDRPEIWISLRTLNDCVAEAADQDRRTAAGERLPLAGLVAAVKDNIDVAGLPTTAAAVSYRYLPDADATAVARLRAAGAIVLGKTNLDQFATGLVGTRSPFGAVRNAWDPARISGGSSSGSAVAVALGIVDVALGTDTAGSGRVPAALNGIVGVKPTRGLIPTTGVVPACRSLDCVSVFARSLELATQTAELLAGPDGGDPRARDAPAPTGLSTTPRVAIPSSVNLEGLAPGWAAAFAAAAQALADTGVEVVTVDIAPLLAAATLLYGGAFVAERFAAVGAHVAAHPELVGSDLDPTVAEIVLSGGRPTAAELFADIERLEQFGVQSRRLLEGCDALLSPTTTSHPTLAAVAADPVTINSRLGRFTNFANLLDMSALAVPAGTVAGLPFGVMFTGPAGQDRALAALALRLTRRGLPLLVVGAHLSGQPLNHQVVSAGGRLLAPVATAADYRLFALDTVPGKPGLVRTEPGAGSSIRGELWELPAVGFAHFVAALPRPMTIGSVLLDDGRSVAGFLCEPIAVQGAREITSYGGWRDWLVSGDPV